MEAVAIAHAECSDDRDGVQHNAQCEHAVDADAREQQAADRGADHAAGIVRADIDRHGGAHLRCADRFADHHPPHRIVGRPADTVDEARDREVPDGEQMQMCQGRKNQRCDHHTGDDDDQRGAPLHALGDGTEEGAEQTHRQQAQHGHHCNDERRAGVLIDEDADGDGLHPADDEHDETDEPEAPEIRAVDQPGRAVGRPGRTGFLHGRAFLGRFSLRLCLG